MSLSQQENIENYEVYNGRMDKSVMDKLFFVDKVTVGNISNKNTWTHVNKNEKASNEL